MRSSILALCLAVPLEPLAAQGSLLLPLDDWAAPLVEHLIRVGVVEDPNPLSRPLSLAELRTALTGADTAMLSPVVRGAVRALLKRLPASAPSGVAYRADLFVGSAAATHDRRELLRETGDSWLAVRGGMHLNAVLGPIALSALPYFDTHLNRDPDWPGDTSQVDIPGRFTDSYVSVHTTYADVFFGSVARNWGPPEHDGLLISAYPFSYDHLALRLGTRHLRVETVLTQLDDQLAADSAVINRFFVAHRVTFRPHSRLLFAIGQGTLWRGAGRTWELRWLNPLKLARSTSIDESLPDSGNTAYLGDLRVELPGRVFLGVQALVDDWGVHAGRSLPNRFAGTVTLDIPVGPQLSARALYTGVSSLTYRSHQGPDFALVRSGVGLGRNHSDYTQATLTATYLVAPTIVLLPEVTWLRQGESDLDRAFPPFPNPDYPFLFVGTVATTWRIALGVRASHRGVLDVAGNAGLHVVRNAGHVAGASREPFVGALSVTWRFGGPIGP